MTRHRWLRWLPALALAGVIGGPLSAQAAEAPQGVTFGVRSAAVYATADGDGGRLRVRFRGTGTADLTRASASLALDELTQVDGDRTLTVTADGTLRRVGRARVYAGWGTAEVVEDGVTVGFERVRIVVSVRGYGHRLRLIGKYVGKTPTGVNDADAPVAPDVLRGVVRGRPKPVEASAD